MNTSFAFRNGIFSLKTRTLHTRMKLQECAYATVGKPISLYGAIGQQHVKSNKNGLFTAPGKSEQPLKDEGIKYSTVQISHDRRGYYIQLMNRQPPVVKIVNKSDEYTRKRQEQEQAKLSKAKQAHKEVQLTWAIGEADVAHKLEKAREELEKGNRVDLVFTHKRGHSIPSEGEMRERIQTVVDSLADVSKEWKGKDFQRRMATAFLQGTESARSHSPQEKIGAQDTDRAVLATKKRKYNVNQIPQEIWDLFKS